ncbi:hypothetical protein PPGU19_082820 (plasmid) [Paraburkholderia sp. PGU19]|nr:hypothetical protein PPGU19_082820 [Paraburkholderia sp. PGU19]
MHCGNIADASNYVQIFCVNDDDFAVAQMRDEQQMTNGIEALIVETGRAPR